MLSMKSYTLHHDPQTRLDTALTRSPALFPRRHQLIKLYQVRDLEEVVSLECKQKTTIYRIHTKTNFKKLWQTSQRMDKTECWMLKGSWNLKLNWTNHMIRTWNYTRWRQKQLQSRNCFTRHFILSILKMQKDQSNQEYRKKQSLKAT